MNELELEERLSRPDRAVIETFSRIGGDLVILGAGGKMGPTLARMARRALDESGNTAIVYAAARFSDSVVEDTLTAAGVKTLRCDLLDRNAVSALPDAPNVIFMAGQKFGTSGNPERTWAVNTLSPAFAAERYARSRFVAFSTGCVYPDVPVGGGGSKESDPLEPLGEYANSCVGRERILEHYSAMNGTPMAFVRLNYANDLRYGVLADVARSVWEGLPVDLTTGFVNVIWQGDANSAALRLLEHVSLPPLALNITGPEKVSVRDSAKRFGDLLDKSPILAGKEGPLALLSDSALARGLLGEPETNLDTMIEWTAEWVRSGGRSLNKPTHYQARDGRY